MVLEAGGSGAHMLQMEIAAFRLKGQLVLTAVGPGTQPIIAGKVSAPKETKLSLIAGRSGPHRLLMVIDVPKWRGLISCN